MPLLAPERRAYARHLLLPEIGEAGQLALCGAAVRSGAGADARAATVAKDYLLRAGVHHGTGGQEVALPATDEVRRRAGDPALEEAAAALAGALAAVETIKAVVGAGTPGNAEWTLGPRE